MMTTISELLKVPCVARCVEDSKTTDGAYWARANLVMIFAKAGIDVKSVYEFMKKEINDGPDTEARDDALHAQVDYWTQRSGWATCLVLRTGKHPVCMKPCGRTTPEEVEFGAVVQG